MSSELEPDDRQRLVTLFERAADLPPSEHAAFVEHECAGRNALRRELERLLGGLASDDILGALSRPGPLPSGTQIGPYNVLERIGEGGMGEVYAAEQREPLYRRVALKIIKPGMASGEVVARFRAERQALARMSHPNVAQVFDAGATADGRPYFAMEYVAGDSITAYCDRMKLPTRDRLRLFLEVCDGVQHAHQKGLIHRDLKPSNILVTHANGEPRVKIIDFGVARATSGRLADRTLHTMVGQVIGTLDYMSPEQADPGVVDIDTRTDIYALGVVLYELVSGLLPFDHGATGSSALLDIVRTIRETDPPTPSTRLRRASAAATSIPQRHGTDPRALIRQIVGDLDWICMKALEKDPSRRYVSVSALADDVRRHLAHEPVLAGRPGPLYRASKFVRRNRTRVGAALLVSIAAALGIAGVVLGRMEARASQRFARAADDYFHAVGLEETAKELWPPHPEAIDALEHWLGRAHRLVDELPQYRVLLEELREDRRRAPDRTRESPSGKDRGQQEAALARLIDHVERLRSGLLAENAVVPGRGWSIPKRLAFARDLEAGFAEGGAYASMWDTALTQIAEARADLDGDGVEELAYPGLRLRPQIGLVPLGFDRDSGLWEFGHLMTGTPAQRDPVTRNLVLTPDTGIVLVLIPGTFDPRQGIPEGAVEGGKLTPFFLSKYEMTQGQWKQLTGDNPSAYGPDGEWNPAFLTPPAPSSLLHPVEQVSWWDCDTWLRRAGLTLPSESQWLRGARGGRPTLFWSGPTVEDVEGMANVRDLDFMEHAGERWARYEDYHDGAAKHWAVGMHKANPFGLHEVHGNVWEWVLDSYSEQRTQDSLALDPVAPPSSDQRRIYCGGSFRHRAMESSFGNRFFEPPSFSGSARGVRPARAIL